MDLREKKTKQSITNAFLLLRKDRPLERIRVKELAELAQISKATFYLHYRDIYDLSDKLQDEVIQSILTGIAHPEHYVTDPRSFLDELCGMFYAQQGLIEILFSGMQANVLPMRIERELRMFVHELLPDMDPKLDVMLTYQIQGGFYAYQLHHKKYGVEQTVELMAGAAEAILDRCL